MRTTPPRRSGVDHTVLPANTHLPLPRSSPEGATLVLNWETVVIVIVMLLIQLSYNISRLYIAKQSSAVTKARTKRLIHNTDIRPNKDKIVQ